MERWKGNYRWLIYYEQKTIRQKNNRRYEATVKVKVLVSIKGVDGIFNKLVKVKEIDQNFIYLTNVKYICFTESGNLFEGYVNEDFST